MASFTFRKLALEDMDAAAIVHRAAFDRALPRLAQLHTPAQDRAYFRGHVFGTCEVFGATCGELLGFVAFRDDGWIEHLYVLPAAQGEGIGTALLAIPQARIASLQLWTFQANTRARQFYERHGFVLAEVTDGARNEEREPDARYVWLRGGDTAGSA